MWAAEGNIIQIKRNQGTPFDQLLPKKLFDGFEINKQHLSCSEYFNQLAFLHLNCKSSQQPLPIVLILSQDDTVRLRVRFTQQQHFSPKKKAVSFNLKSRAEYLCRYGKIDFRGGNCRIKKTVPVSWKIGIKPFNWVWLQLDLTTDSSPVVSYYFVSGQGTVAGDYQTLVRRGRWEGESGNEVSFLLPIIRRTSLYRASLVNINRRLRELGTSQDLTSILQHNDGICYFYLA